MFSDGYVCLPVIDLFRKPDVKSEVISQALYGWQVSVMQKLDNYLYIQTPDDYEGWIEAEGIKYSTSFQGISKRLKILFNAVPIYSQPHVKNHPLWIFPFEVELPVLEEPMEEEGRWIKIGLLDGTMGWIQRGHVKMDPAPLSFADLIDLSHQFLGVPYIWGGTSSFGYDCSGFIQMLLRQNGICFPRDAKEQIQDPACDQINWEKLERGDLIFYGSSEKEISHVGLYLGNHTLIHSTVKPIPIVQVSHLEDPILQKRFTYRTARRLSYNN